MNSGIYSAGFVVNIIVNGQMQKVSKDNLVSIPFNSEYKIRLQNKNSRRAVVKVFIDDENVSETGLIIPANDSIELERPTDKQFKFKFVSLDSGQAADAGKSKNRNGEKGVLRFEFRLEKQYEYRAPLINAYPNPWRKGGEWEQRWTNDNENYRYDGHETSCDFDGIERPVKTSGGINLPQNYGTLRSSTSKGFEQRRVPVDDVQKSAAGCTVSGEKSNQSFTTAYIDLEDASPVLMQLTLRGFDEKSSFDSENDSVYCSGCGKKAVKSTDRFCSRCGNKLSR